MSICFVASQHFQTFVVLTNPTTGLNWKQPLVSNKHDILLPCARFGLWILQQKEKEVGQEPEGEERSLVWTETLLNRLKCWQCKSKYTCFYWLINSCFTFKRVKTETSKPCLWISSSNWTDLGSFPQSRHVLCTFTIYKDTQILPCLSCVSQGCQGVWLV